MNLFQEYLGDQFVLKRPSKAFYRSAVSFLLAGICVGLSYHYMTGLSNVSFWVVLTVMMIAGLGCLGAGIRMGTLLCGIQEWKNPFINLTIVVCSVMVVVIGLEGFLGWNEQQVLHILPKKKRATRSSPVPTGLNLKPEVIAYIEKRQKVLTMPVEWERRAVKIPGAAYAYYWHEVLHVHDKENFRRTTPFPPKSPDTFRIMVVGDSLTYGYGIEEQYTYSHIIQKRLEENYRVEVLNLGVSGNQSENILAVVRKFLPWLHPDLVLYGVCLNDFLPSGQGEYNGRGYEFPLPERVKDLLIKNTRAARYVSDLYDKSLRTAGLRFDFFDDILQDFDGYQQRFGQDVLKMNQFVQSQGLPPVLTMILDQYPRQGGRGYRISRVAERLLGQAGMDVIDTEDFYARFNGAAMHVSRWEGHPNELANAVFANMFLKELNGHPALQPFRKP